MASPNFIGLASLGLEMRFYSVLLFWG